MIMSSRSSDDKVLFMDSAEEEMSDRSRIQTEESEEIDELLELERLMEDKIQKWEHRLPCYGNTNITSSHTDEKLLHRTVATLLPMLWYR